MRTLLLGVAAFALALTIARTYFFFWWEDQRRIRALSTVYVQVHREPRGQYFFRRLFGNSLSQRAVYVHASSSSIDDDWLLRVAELEHVEVLSIWSPQVTDVGVAHLATMRNLQSLHLSGTQVTEAGLEKLRLAAPKLKLIRSERGLR
ncbi:MAG: hypothetical protein H0T51_26395 [Pirellulales bacterium]|nr:hypothetical protein [Pirellulales bacterium]